MTRIVIGSALSMALAATIACGGSSPSSPSASPSASPSTTAFSAQTFSAGTTSTSTLGTLDHDHSGGDGHGHEAELEGAIVSIDTAHKTFVVRSTTVNVLDATVIRHGNTMLTFADLKVGDQVHVKGATNGTAVDAREIKLQNDGTDNGRDDANDAEGLVSGLTGTCPAVTFTVGTKKVATNATTMFGRSACTDVVNGAKVEVEGTVQTDGSILATRVSVDNEKGDDGD